MPISVHPLADEWTEEYAVFVVENDRVTLSRPLRHFFADCRARMVRPVLLTNESAVLSPHLYAAMVDSGAHWAFRDADGWFDARSGSRISDFPDMWSVAPSLERHSPMPSRALMVPTVLFDIYSGDRAVHETSIGPLADHAIGALGGGLLARTGADEPLVAPWNHTAITRIAQSQMPMTEPQLATGDAASWVSVTVGRTRDGLIERAQGGVPYPHWSSVPTGDLRDRVMPAVTTMLAGLVEKFRPRVALVSGSMLGYQDGTYGHRVGAQPFDAPLALLIGPRAVRDLDLDIADLSTRHNLTVLGPGRVPSLLVRLTGQEPLWSQLHAFAFDLDQERLAAALSPTPGRMFS